MATTKDKRQIRIKRAYEAPARSDGVRILVDRVWPRGVTKGELRLDDWVKEVAPSTELRKWFDHDPMKWREFQDRYARELNERPEAVERVMAMCGAGIVTLVFGSRETRYNNAVALKAYLERRSTS